MTEKGTILEAQVNAGATQMKDIASLYDAANISSLLHEENLTIADSHLLSSLPGSSAYSMFPHDSLRFSSVSSLTLRDKENDTEKQYLYQYTGDYLYGIGMITQ